MSVLGRSFFLQARFSSIRASEKQAIARFLPHLMRKPESPLADGACQRCRLSLQAAAGSPKKITMLAVNYVVDGVVKRMSSDFADPGRYRPAGVLHGNGIDGKIRG
jgi:hypothetical protein